MIHAGSTLDGSLNLTIVTGVKVNRWQKCTARVHTYSTVMAIIVLSFNNEQAGHVLEQKLGN